MHADCPWQKDITDILIICHLYSIVMVAVCTDHVSTPSSWIMGMDLSIKPTTYKEPFVLYLKKNIYPLIFLSQLTWKVTMHSKGFFWTAAILNWHWGTLCAPCLTFTLQDGTGNTAVNTIFWSILSNDITIVFLNLKEKYRSILAGL